MVSFEQLGPAEQVANSIDPVQMPLTAASDIASSAVFA